MKCLAEKKSRQRRRCETKWSASFVGAAARGLRRAAGRSKSYEPISPAPPPRPFLSGRSRPTLPSAGREWRMDSSASSLETNLPFRGWGQVLQLGEPKTEKIVRVENN